MEFSIPLLHSSTFCCDLLGSNEYLSFILSNVTFRSFHGTNSASCMAGSAKRWDIQAWSTTDAIPQWTLTLLAPDPIFLSTRMSCMPPQSIFRSNLTGNQQGSGRWLKITLHPLTLTFICFYFREWWEFLTESRINHFYSREWWEFLTGIRINHISRGVVGDQSYGNDYNNNQEGHK